MAVAVACDLQSAAHPLEREVVHLVDHPAVHRAGTRRPSAGAPSSSNAVITACTVTSAIGRESPGRGRSSRAARPGRSSANAARRPRQRSHGDDLQQLQERLQPERAGPDRVLVEVGLEEPRRRVDRLAARDEAQPVRAAVGDEQRRPGRSSAAVVGERRLARIGERSAARQLRRRRLVGHAPRGCRPAAPGPRCEKKPKSSSPSVDRPVAGAHLEVVVLDDHAAGAATRWSSCTRVVSVPASGATGASCVAVPPRLRKRQVVGARQGRADVGRQPAARLQGDLQQHGERHHVAGGSAAKYQASGGTSYSASTTPPATIFHGSAVDAR